MRLNAVYKAGFLLCLAAGCTVNRPGGVHHRPSLVPMRTLNRPLRVAPDRRTASTVVPDPRFAWFLHARSWRPRGGISNRWDAIVIHHSGSPSGNARLFDRHHRRKNGWDELGYHFVIGNGRGSGDGQVEVGPRWIKQKHGAHCKTSDNYYNNHGIGICLVGDFRAAAPTKAQMESLVRLVHFLMVECRILGKNVKTHRGVTGKTICPGPKFPFKSFRRMIGPHSGS